MATNDCYIMKRYIFILFLMTLWVGSVYCQPRFTPTATSIDVGKVEWKTFKKVQYTITNTGNAPLVLTDVDPDCSCTVANWTQNPISPGETGTIDLTFEAETLGHFQKSVVVWTNTEPHIAYLSFKGQVLPEVKDYSTSHPYHIGDILLDTTSIEFLDIHIGEMPKFHMSMANMSQENWEPILMHLPPYLTMMATKEILLPEDKCDVELTLDTRLLPDYGLTQSSVYLSRFPGDKVGEQNEIPITIVLLPDFSNLTEEERLNLPHIELSTTELDMSAELAAKTKARKDLTITNTGNSTLKIGKLQVFNSAVSADIKSTNIAPGQTVNLRVTVNKKTMLHQRGQMRLLLLCNDPENPLITVNIKVAP